MKFIVGLSSLALISLSSVSPSLAANQSLSPSADQSLPSATKTIQVANSFGSVTEVINTVDGLTQIGNRETTQENFAKQRRQRVNMYQQRKQQSAAAAAARREQERRYFESLTPEQQKQYIAQRRARQEQQARQMLLILGIFGAAMQYGNSGTAPTSNVNQERWIVEDRYNRPSAPQPAPPPAPSINPCFYGNGPCSP